MIIGVVLAAPVIIYFFILAIFHWNGHITDRVDDLVLGIYKSVINKST